MPQKVAETLTPAADANELGDLTVIHPTPNDPVLISEKKGPVAIWFKF
jgi:hypothetical protein